MRSKLVKKIEQWLKKMFGITPVHTLMMKESLLLDLCEMAASAHPKEMLAFLAATKGNRNGTLIIDEIQLQAYVASEDSASFHTWNMPTVTSIIGTVHSHPGGSMRPSDADLHLFSKFGFVHAIIGEPYRPQNIRFYDKNGKKILVHILPESVPLH